MYTTLFLLASLDGKISTGCSDTLDFDTDLAADSYLSKGLYQYYDIERTMDEWSVISGRIAAKLGANNGTYFKEFVPVSFIVIDSSHLTPEGRQHIADNCERVVFVMPSEVMVHCAKHCASDNMDFILQNPLDLKSVLNYIEYMYCAKRVTVQTGGTLNRLFLQQGAIDAVDIVIAPMLIGGKTTASMVDGDDRYTKEGLSDITKLMLQEVKQLKFGYVRMRYTVVR